MPPNCNLSKDIRLSSENDCRSPRKSFSGWQSQLHAQHASSQKNGWEIAITRELAGKIIATRKLALPNRVSHPHPRKSMWFSKQHPINKEYLQISPLRRSREAITFSSVETMTRLLPVFWVWKTAFFTLPTYFWCLNPKRHGNLTRDGAQHEVLGQ